MKKIIFLLLFFLFNMSFSQESGDTLYKESRMYDYSTYESKELIKLKTENYLLDLIAAGFKIKKNEVTRDKIDINITYIINSNSSVNYNVIYYFEDSYYNVRVFYPVCVFNKPKKLIDVDITNPNHRKLIDTIENLMFKNYQTYINSNF
ncbi:hypothetical protein [Elizabethkingia anophelis]|uniref:hypothetical protein n=1 Tax=Elizabethkingia anophelis TaxID=1117645 RepID=UPI0024E0CA21|nr:hypothetical protein [Elizabethkingia anophelis]HDP3253975.1 hypothetical protein [Elizabethkingia anophelis]